MTRHCNGRISNHHEGNLKEIFPCDWFAEIYTNNASDSRSSYCSLKHTNYPRIQPSLGPFFPLFQPPWYGTGGCIGRLGIVSERISFAGKLCGNWAADAVVGDRSVTIPKACEAIKRYPYFRKPIATQLSCRTDRANLISTAPWFKFPYPLQWGPPTFSAGHSFAMMSAVLVSMVESTGAYKAASRLAIATPPPAYVLSRGIGWQGIGIMLDGLFGTVTGSTVSVENVGLLGLSRVGSRRVVQMSAAFMMFFSILGKFGAVFASIPFPIFAALYCVLFGLVGSVGLSFLQFTNMNCMRNLIITGLSLFLGISIPQFFNEYWNPSHRGLVHTNAGWFNAFMNTVLSSPATVGLTVAVFLDNTIEVEKSKKDRGMPWWVKFRTFRGDNRNEEFYTLPFNLNRMSNCLPNIRVYVDVVLIVEFLDANAKMNWTQPTYIQNQHRDSPT
ncbi:hypothetical protein V6N11_046049 [Hibiscus sabdariffa]|uniref:Nucleobase-ascorbate transporter 1 n=1 Tax=Hibiscus sabdariffa TaxID=183260 RepID=A0ABR2Q2X4_9ROSI